MHLIYYQLQHINNQQIELRFRVRYYSMVLRTTHKLRKKIMVILPMIMVLFLVGCVETESLKEGVITYDIEYLDEVHSNPLIGMLPSKMNVMFKPGFVKTNIEGMWGFFNFRYIANTETGENYTLLRLVDKKYSYMAPDGNIAYGYDQMQNVRIEHTTDTDTIIGYECKKGLAYSPSFGSNPQAFYYTTDINIFAPNINNPYSEIPGVLMKFQVILNGIRMKMTARGVVYKKLSSKAFDIPEDYNKVNKNEIHKVLEPYFTSSRNLSEIPLKR